MSKEKFYKTSPEEQEVVINLNRKDKEMKVYTSDLTIYTRFIKRIGQPNKKYYIRNQITGGDWIFSFDNKSIKNIIVRSLLV